MIKKISESTWTIFALLRFLLAFIVVCSHMKIYFFGKLLAKPLAFIAMMGGKAAVLCFLLLSGISICYSYFKSKNGYIKRRFLRIYPLYLIAVLFTILIQYMLGSPYITSSGFTFASAGLLTSFANIILLQGIMSVTITYNQALWSISAEVFFYLLLPIIVKLNNKVIVSIIALSILTYTFTYNYIPFQALFGFINFIYIWPWLIGFLIIQCDNKLKPLILILIGIIAFAQNKILNLDSYGWVTFLIFSLMIFITISNDFKIPKTLKNIFIFMGELSYPLYLFHMPLFLLFSFWQVKCDWVYLLLAIIFIIPINYIFDKVLKNIFWKPLVLKIESYLHTIKYKTLSLNSMADEN